MGGHGGHHEMGGGGMMMGGSPERMGRMIDHMLDRLNGTDAQRSQIKQIVQAAATDLKSQRDAHRALRQQGMQIFTRRTSTPMRPRRCASRCSRSTTRSAAA